MEQELNDINFDNYVVVGVSAGPDSMCLLNLLEKKTNKIIVCHINHNIREQSIIEEEYLKTYCQEHNLIFESMTIKEYKENNFENEARKIRYKYYEEILNKYNSNKLFLAHHGDDLIETILMKIERVSNIEGYAGIKRISKLKNYDIIRPLLPYTKEDIITYNKSHNITYYIDSSNTNIDYTRNWYRHKVLPILKEKDKNIHLKFLKYSETLQEYNEYIDREINKKLSTIYQNNIINIDVLNKEDYFLKKNILYYIMNDIYNNESNIITEKHIQNILTMINSNKPNLSINMPQSKILVKEYNKLYIKKNIKEEKKYKIIFENTTKIDSLEIKKVSEEESDGNNICRLNSKDIKFPLYIRNRKDGDYMILKNSNYKKKIKEIFIENKLPISKRNNYPLLIDSDDKVLWIPNMKKSNLCYKKDENYDIIIKCIEREEDYE